MSPPARGRAQARRSTARRRRPGRRRSRRACGPMTLRSALAELRALARLLQAGLLALLDARVAREEAAPLELAAEVGIGLEQRAADAVAQGAGLGGDPAAVHARDDVHARLVADRLERLADVALQGRAREERLEAAAVDDVRAVAWLEDHARDGGLALAGRAVAGVGGEVDRDGGDRLVVGHDVLCLLGQRLGLLVLVVRALAVLGALHDDVDLEVGAGDLGLDAGSGLLLVLLVVLLVVPGRGDRLLGGRRGLGGKAFLRGGLLLAGGGLLAGGLLLA